MTPDHVSPALSDLQQAQVGKLLAETDIYVKHGLMEKALERLQTIFAIVPGNIDARLMAYSAFSALGNHESAFEQLLHVLRLRIGSGQAPTALPCLARILALSPGAADVPAVLGALRGAGVPAISTRTFEQLLDLLTQRVSREAARARPYLEPILQLSPDHPDVPGVLAALVGVAEPEDLDADDNEILCDAAED